MLSPQGVLADLRCRKSPSQITSRTLGLPPASSIPTPLRAHRLNLRQSPTIPRAPPIILYLCIPAILLPETWDLVALGNPRRIHSHRPPTDLQFTPLRGSPLNDCLMTRQPLDARLGFRRWPNEHPLGAVIPPIQITETFHMMISFLLRFVLALLSQSLTPLYQCFTRFVTCYYDMLSSLPSLRLCLLCPLCIAISTTTNVFQCP